MLTSEFQSILREMLHGLGGAQAERSDSGVIQIDQTLSYRELIPILLPEGVNIGGGLPTRRRLPTCPTHLIHTAHKPPHGLDQEDQQCAEHDAESRDNPKKQRQRERFINGSEASTDEIAH